MELHVYNGEKFERNIARYIGFSVIFISCIVISIINQNIIGALILFFILGTYLYYSLLSNQLTKIHIDEKYIIIDKKSHVWSDFTSYTLEIDKKTNEIKNIILLYPKGYTIYTIKDKDENIRKFSKILDEYIPLVGNFEQSFLEKIIRVLKL